MSARGRSQSPRGRGAPRARSQDSSRSGTPDDAEHLLAALSSSLRVSRPNLHKVSPAILEEAVAALAFPLPERARLSIALADLAPPSPPQQATAEATLISYFSEKEKRANERWRTTAAAVQQQRVALAKNTPEALQDLFLDLAKCGAVGAEDGLTLAYLLFGSPEDRLYYAGLLLTTAGLERVRAHNFTTAAGDDTFLSAYGPLLETFPWPIFPRDRRFTALTQKLLASVSLSGGGPQRKQPTPAVYKEVVHLFGGSFVPVLGPDGVQFAAAEVSVLEKQLADITAQISRMRAGTGGQDRGGYSNNRARGARGRGRGNPNPNHQQQQRGDSHQRRGNSYYGGAGDGTTATAPPAHSHSTRGPKNDEEDE